MRQGEPDSGAPEPMIEADDALTSAPEPAAPERSLDLMGETPPSPVIDEPVLVLPSLAASDEFVRARLSDALPDAWQQKDDLLRRAAVVIENANRGEIPRRQLAFLAPEGPFAVREVEIEGEEEPRKFIDPQTYARYDPYLDMLEALPASELASLLNDSQPLLDEAMAELGSQEEILPQVLTAIDQILAVPVLRGDVELVQPKVFYEYADPALEGLSGLQKQVLRMGPDNVERLQAYLEDLRERLVSP